MQWMRFLALVGAFVATVFFFDRLYVPIPTWADKTVVEYDKKKDSIDVVIIGNSHTGAIGQSKIGQLNAMNFSYSGMEMKDRLVLLREIVKRRGPLKYVIMAMDYDQIGHKTSDAYLENMLLPYSIGQEQGAGKYVKRLNATNFLRHNRNFGLLVDYYVRGKQLPGDAGFVPVAFIQKADGTACRKRATELSRLNFSPNNIAANEELILQARDLLQEHHVKLVLVNTPKASCFQQAYADVFDMQYATRLKRFLATHGIVYLDYANSRGFTDEDMLDFDHLSQAGAKKICDSIHVSLNGEVALAEPETHRSTTE